MLEPEWLTRARAEGRILSERSAGSSLSPSAHPGTIPEKPVSLPRAAKDRNQPVYPTRVVIELDIPIRLTSEANAGGSLKAKIGRKSLVKAAIAGALPRLASPLTAPFVVTLTRLGGKPLDEDDNLPRALKAVKDVVALWLGVEDTGRDDRVMWRYRQLPDWRSGCRIRIESRPPRIRATIASGARSRD